MLVREGEGMLSFVMRMAAVAAVLVGFVLTPASVPAVVAAPVESAVAAPATQAVTPVSTADATTTGAPTTGASTTGASTTASTTTAAAGTATTPAIAAPGLVSAAVGDVAGCGIACTGISASPRELAQWLLNARDQGRFQVDPTIDEIWATEIAPIANGTVDPRCDIDGRVLQTLVVSIKAFGTVKINDLNRWCANDGEYNCTGEYHPPSPWHCRIPAVAVDFGRVGTQRTNGWGDGSNSLIALMNQFMPANTHLGQQGCFGRPSMKSLGYSYLTNEFADTCNHLHVDIGQSTTGLRVAAGTGLPLGSYDSAYALPGAIRVTGWAADLDTTQPVQVAISIDGQVRSTVTANGSRPDVEAVYPGIGTAHGFAATLSATPGAHQVCASAADVGGGGSSQLGCSTVTVMTGAPIGSLDSATRSGSNITVAGWAFDPDTVDPIDVVFTLNGVTKTTVTATGTRADLAAVYPGYGGAHGYSTTFTASGGTSQVCAYGLDSATRQRGPALGCLDVLVPLDPFGSLDTATVQLNSATLTGWAADPDQPTTSLAVHAYVGGPDGVGTWGGAFTANAVRTDVGAVYPGYGNKHGYQVTVTVPSGTTPVCLYAINVGSGSNSLLGCRSVSTPTGPVTGNLEVASLANGQVSLKGWALDPDTAASIAAHVYVNGTWYGAYTADAVRSDVGTAYPGYGAKHGIAISGVKVPVGTNDVCVWGIDSSGGQANALIGCKTLSSASGPPRGSLDATSVGLGSLSVSGWALDPDTPNPIDVHVYVDGVWRGAVTANATRNDVAAAFPGYGSAHGYSLTLSAGGGPHQVCVYGINVRDAGNPLIACTTVQVPGGNPFGNVESASVKDGKATVVGWAIDPDVAAAVAVHVYVNGAWGGSATADRTRADVGRAYPLYGSAHGFSVTVPVPVGASQVCVYGINQATGSTNPSIGCVTVTR
jgi:hypothetical protein